MCGWITVFQYYILYINIIMLVAKFPKRFAGGGGGTSACKKSFEQKAFIEAYIQIPTTQDFTQ